MAVELVDGKPIIEFTGGNGSEIATAMTEYMRQVRNSEITIQVGELSGSDLSLDQLYDDGHLAKDRWRVPMGYRINVATGEVLNSSLIPQDYAEITKEEEANDR